MPNCDPARRPRGPAHGNALQPPRPSLNAHPAAPAMDWQAWAAQWRRLVSELQAAEGAAADALPAAPADAARSEAQARRTATQLRQQVAKHLAAVETLCAAAAADPSPRASPQLARRAQRCEAAAAQLRAAQQHQLREARQEEEQLGAEYEASMQRVQQLLQGAPYAPARAQHEAGHGSAGGASSRRQSVTVAAAASAAATEGGLPPEVAACDAFLQRHGPTGVPGAGKFVGAWCSPACCLGAGPCMLLTVLRAPAALPATPAGTLCPRPTCHPPPTNCPALHPPTVPSRGLASRRPC